MIDLHSHTTASDGQHTPAELFALAQAAGVTVLGVTDHDTVSGLADCQREADARGMRLVPGIEISIRWGGREVHILGHFIDPTEPKLAQFGEHLRHVREERMGQMVEKIRALGFPVTLEQVKGLAGNAHLARPHLARVLVELNYCSSTKEAFDRFLGDGRPAHVERFDVTLEQAIGLIHGAGGTATVAHPGATRIERHELGQLAQAGLDGVEVDHTDHPPSKREQLLKWTHELGLVATGGTDFHGEAVAPNRRFGKIAMPADRFAALEARRPRP